MSQFIASWLHEGRLLLYHSQNFPIRPTVTVEISEKWYDLFLVWPNGNVTTADVSELDDVAFNCRKPDFYPSAYVDHVFNPAIVEEWARQKNYDIQDEALEMMIGRWILESQPGKLGVYTPIERS